jgi:hypothetical protein
VRSAIRIQGMDFTITVRTARMIFFLAAAAWCCSAFGQTTEIDARSYAIFSFLRVQLKPRDDFRIRPVIAPFTNQMVKPPRALAWEKGQWIQERLRGLTSETLESFEHCADRSVSVGHRFDLPFEYEIAKPEESENLKRTEDIRRLYTQHPQANSYISFSCVGLNAAGTQALFFVERWGQRFPNSGAWILMQLDATDHWIIQGKLVEWAV